MVNGFWEFMKKDKNAVIIDNILKIKIEERIPVKERNGKPGKPPLNISVAVSEWDMSQVSEMSRFSARASSKPRDSISLMS